MSVRDLKEMLRMAIAMSGLSRVHAKFRRLRGENVSHLFIKDRAGRFARIYEAGVWLNDRSSGSLSGLGSDPANTVQMREGLPKILEELGVKRLLDIGCGDWSWMRHVELRCGYIGADIVPSVIESNRSAYAAPGRSFVVLDAVTDPIPDCDAVLCREVLFHLSLADARALIANVSRSSARFLLATTDIATSFNSDIITGDFRILNLRKRPFHFPEPMGEIPDDDLLAGRRIAIWRLSDLRMMDALR